MTANDTINLLPPEEKAQAEKILGKSRGNDKLGDFEYNQPLASPATGDNFTNPVVKNTVAVPAPASSSPIQPAPARSILEDMDIDSSAVAATIAPAVELPTPPPPPPPPAPVWTSPAVPTPPPPPVPTPISNNNGFNIPISEPVNNPFENKNEALPVSLLPQSDQKAAVRGRSMAGMIIWLVLCLIIVGGYGATLMWRLNNLKQINQGIDNQIKETEKNIAAMGEVKTKVQALQNKVTRAQELLTKHSYPTNLITYLEYYTLSGTAYSGLSINTGKDLALKTTAASYESAARQVKLLQIAKDFSQEVKISEIKMSKTKDGERAGFNLTLILADNVFQFKEKITRPQ